MRGICTRASEGRREETATGPLLKQMEEYCLRHGYRKILEDTENHMVSAVKLYERYGYRKIREMKEEIDGKTYTTYFYEKDL